MNELPRNSPVAVSGVPKAGLGRSRVVFESRSKAKDGAGAASLLRTREATNRKYRALAGRASDRPEHGLVQRNGGGSWDGRNTPISTPAEHPEHPGRPHSM